MQNSSSEPHSSNMSVSASKAVKKGQNQQNKEKNDIFYVKKRGLFRKAEQVVRYCNSDVFIIVHNKDSDKIFSFTSDQKFNLQSISSLVLRDMQHAAYLNKNRKFEDVDFEKVKQDINEIQKINRQLPPSSEFKNKVLGGNQQIMQKNSFYQSQKQSEMNGTNDNTETYTEDVSMSVNNINMNEHQAIDRAYPVKSITSPKQNAMGNGNSQTFEKQYNSPKTQKSVQFQDSNAEGYRNQQKFPDQQYFYKQTGQKEVQKLPFNNIYQKDMDPTKLGESQGKNIQNQQLFKGQQQQATQKHSFYQQYGGNMQKQYGFGQNLNQQHPNNQIYETPIQVFAQQNEFEDIGQYQQFQSPRNNTKYGSQVLSSHSQADQDFDKHSKYSVDINQYHKDKFEKINLEHQFQKTVDNNDIFTCYDIDAVRENRKIQKAQGLGNAGMIKPPNETKQASGLPITSSVDFNQKGKSIAMNHNNKNNHLASQVIDTSANQFPPQMMSQIFQKPSNINMNFEEQNFQDVNRHLSQRQMFSPTSHMDGDFVEQYIQSPRNIPQQTVTHQGIKSYTKYKDSNKDSGTQRNISKISIESKQNFLKRSGIDQMSVVNNDSMNDINQRKRIISSGVMQFQNYEIPTERQFFSPSKVMHKNMSKDKYQKENIEERRRSQNTAGKGSSDEGKKQQPLFVQSINEQNIFNINYNNFDQNKQMQNQNNQFSQRINYDEFQQQQDFEVQKDYSFPNMNMNMSGRKGYDGVQNPFNPAYNNNQSQLLNKGNSGGSIASGPVSVQSGVLNFTNNHY